MLKRSVYPFTAIVGQERMKRALILNAVNPSIGGVLIRGERGTAKSTAARALAALLPDIEVVADSPFNDDPKRPETWSDAVRERANAGEQLPVATRQTRLVELPVSATEDRVVGTLDIEKAIKQGERHFDPGVLAAANRGILYVDEVNLLDDHIVDLLLDSAAMGINIVEREGISFQHPARFILVGTMNPEEGDLRPQIMDRFGLRVAVRGLTDSAERLEVYRRVRAYRTNPQTFIREWLGETLAARDEVEAARRILPQVTLTDGALTFGLHLIQQLDIDSHRAEYTMFEAARAYAAADGRLTADESDIRLVALMALRQRRSQFMLDFFAAQQIEDKAIGAQMEASRIP